MLADDRLGALRGRLQAAEQHFNAGRIGEAAALYRDILDQVPDQPDALHMLGAIAFRMGRSELALQLYDEAVKAVPRFALAWSNRALILRTMNRDDEAMQSARTSIACDPLHADGWNMAGLLLRQQRRYDASCEYHLRARALNPRNHHIQNNCAVALATLGRLEDAYRAAHAAVALMPDFAIGYLTIANILGAAGWPERAIIYFRKAQELDPAVAHARGSEGRALMLIGDFAQGWEKMETRDYDLSRFQHLPRWQGNKVHHLLVYGEQGVGDILHFMRYFPTLRERTHRITLEVPASMKRLMAAQAPDFSIMTPDEPVPAADALGLLMSLPAIVKTAPETIPGAVPYLFAEDVWRQPWRSRLAARAAPRIGIVWMGNPLYPNDHNRSLTLDEIRPLLAVARPHFVSLQKGPVTATSSQAAIFDAADDLTDYADTAGLIAELDLVITVDTGIAHMAGAMGKPVWTLLPFAPDWRWLLAREDTPWYPTMRLFRQTVPRNWPPVVERVSAELKAFIAGDRSLLTPKPWQGPLLRSDPNAIALPGDPAT